MKTLKSDVDELIMEIEINAPPDLVFRALTDPDHLKAWWGSKDAYWCESWEVDAKVGGKYRCEGRNVKGEPFTVYGEYLQIDPPHTLSYTWNPSWAEMPATKVTYSLRALSNKTVVVVRHTGFAEYPEARKMHEGGWPLVLGWLQAYFV